MKPYVPREDPTEASRPDRRWTEAPPPEDPEERYARLKRKERRRRAAVIAMSLAALMIGGAVLLDRGLVDAPTGVSSFGDDVELPDLENTWVGKALDEARKAREAEAGPRGVIRPLGDRNAAASQQEEAEPSGAQARAAEAPPSSAQKPSSASEAGPQPASSTSRPAARHSAQATRSAVEPEAQGPSGAAATARESGATRPAPAPAKTAGSRDRLARASTAEKTPEPASTPVPKGAALPPAEPVEIISTADGEAGVQVISIPEGEAVDDDAFYEDPDPDGAPVDPEQFRPRRPWPVPGGAPPASGRVGSFSLITLPAAEVRFREHSLGSTPLHGQQLPSGRQRLILVGPDGVRRVLILDIHADEHTEIQLPVSRLMPEALMP